MRTSIFDHLVKYDIEFKEVNLLGGIEAIICRKVSGNLDIPTAEFMVILEPSTNSMKVIFTETTWMPDGPTCLSGAAQDDDQVRDFFGKVMDLISKSLVV